MRLRRPRPTALAPILVLLLLPTLLLWRVVSAGDVFLPADLLRDVYPWRGSNPGHLLPWNPLMWDGVAEFYPWRLFAAQSLRAGWLPLWNPHQLCGTPFVANSQSAVFYPPNLLFCLLPVARAFGVSVWLHLALTGLLMYGFLRGPAWALSGPAALLGAVAWQMSAWQVSWLALPTFLCVSCWLPLALWLTWRAVADRPLVPRPKTPSPPGPLSLGRGEGEPEKSLNPLPTPIKPSEERTGLGVGRVRGLLAPEGEGRVRGLAGGGRMGRWAALGVCLGVMILAGHLQIALYCLGLTFAYGVFLFFSSPPPKFGRGGRGARAGWGAALGALLALGLMAGLAAPQLLPAVELARVSHRAGTPVTWASYQSYVSLALPALNLVTLWLPGFFGSPTQGTYWGVMVNGGPSAYMENACSVGILALALAFLGVAAAWRQSLGTRFFAAAAGAALLLALGTPLDALPYFGLPGFAQSGSPGRVLVVWTFCAALLAAVGADRLIAGAVRWDRTAQGALAVFVGAFGIALAGTLLWIARDGLPGALAANLPRVGDLWRVPAGVLLGAAAALWLRGRGSLSPAGTGMLLAGLAAVDLLAGNWDYNRTTSVGRVYPETAGIAYLRQHAGADRVLFLNHGWSIEGNRPPDALLPPDGATVYGLNDIAGYDSLLTRRSFQFVAALDDGRNPAPPENGNLVFTGDYHSPQAQAADARYVVSRAALPDRALTLVAQDAGMFVYANPDALPRARTANGAVPVSLEDIAPTRVEMRVTGAGSGALVLADQWYPGWQAVVNGEPGAMSLEEGMFRRVTVPPGGPARIEMRYRPTVFRVGLYGFLLALATVAGLAAGRSGRRRSG